MKIIFLDIDGVLNSEKTMIESRKKHGESHFEDNPHPMHLKHLNKIIEETGAKVVISSTWRKGSSAFMIARLLYACGFKGEVVGKTPSLGKKRGEEIQKWITEYNNGDIWYLNSSERDNWTDTVESFVILDDDSDMCHLMDHLVKTTWETGLDESHVQKAIDILNEVK